MADTRTISRCPALLFVGARRRAGWRMWRGDVAVMDVKRRGPQAGVISLRQNPGHIQSGREAARHRARQTLAGPSRIGSCSWAAPPCCRFSCRSG